MSIRLRQVTKGRARLNQLRAYIREHPGLTAIQVRLSCGIVATLDEIAQEQARQGAGPAQGAREAPPAPSTGGGGE